MKSLCLAVLAWLLAAPGGAQTPATREAPTAWPAITQSAKPWTRWWWPGSAVERGQITAQLEAMAAAGIGGVEITPIYGARGADARYLQFLSPRWVEMLTFASQEAQRLGLGVFERNERAQAFYRKHGFRQVGTQIFVVGTDPQTDHIMLREL